MKRQTETQRPRLNESPFENFAFEKGKAKIAILIGGGFQILGAYPEVANADIV